MEKETINKRYKKKFYNNQYEMELPYYKNDDSKTFLIVGDIHYHEHVPKMVFHNLLINAKKINPDFIIIPGDIIETNQFIENLKEKKFFEDMLKSLASIAPLIMTAGNHEIANYNRNIDRSSTPQTINYLESFNKLPNIYFLNNKQIKIDNITFTGFTPNLEYYYNYNSKESETISYLQYEKSNLRMNKEEFNVLISHIVPKDFNDKDITDFTISGHWHDGCVPKILDRFFENTDKGIFFENFPSKKSTSVKYARGINRFGRGYVLVTQGYRKHTADLFLFNMVERVMANDVEVVTIKKGSAKIKKIK